jgi:Ca2+-binding RTX toxin-like protein
MEGGYGDDNYLVDNAGDLVIEADLGGKDMVRSSVSFTLGAHVEHLELTGSAGLSGTGNALSNLILGNNAGNILRGEVGNDMIRGAMGDDMVHGGAGADKLFGEAGNDTLYGNSGGQRGSAADSSADFLDGGTGNDKLHGEGGNDHLLGAGGDDLLFGGAGSDKLVGGIGSDQFTGGDGADSFVFLSAFDVMGHEFIHGFETGVDKIDLSGIDANGALAGNGTFALLGEGQPDAPVAGSVWLESTGSATFVHGDLNGDAVTDFRLDLWGATVTGADLIL